MDRPPVFAGGFSFDAQSDRSNVAKIPDLALIFARVVMGISPAMIIIFDHFNSLFPRLYRIIVMEDAVAASGATPNRRHPVDGDHQ